jgi:hypothetical protein
MNIASGCPLFMPLSKLDDASVSYVKDDVMFVNVCLDIAETRRSGTDAGTDRSLCTHYNLFTLCFSYNTKSNELLQYNQN